MRLIDCYIPVFKQIIHITGNQATFENYNDCRQHCITVLNHAIHMAGELDVSEDEKEAARTAVIAWIDETILCSTLPWRQHWQVELLQRKYLNINVAGEHFFTQLSRLSPTHDQARTVFLFCLQQGFCGQYSRPDDQPALLEVIAQQRKLCLPDDWLNWPNEATITPDTPALPEHRSIRRRPLLTLSVAIVLLYGSLYLFLHHYVS
ncbi:DotU family type IV/VI secretion system protein [Enterobacter asburiae]|nr:DotU family type IV/VI secretion system protein [Enterobacter asburiae]